MFSPPSQHDNEDYPRPFVAPSPAFPLKYYNVKDGSLRACRVYDLNKANVIEAESVLMRNESASEAFWRIKPLRQMIGGEVYYAVRLKPASEVPHNISTEMARHQVDWAISEDRVVIKQFSLRDIKGNHWEKMVNEIRALRYIQAHHEVTPLHSLVVPVDILTSSMMYCWIVLPFYKDENLFDYAKQSDKRLDENFARGLLKQMLLAIQELRRIGLYHGGISGENIMVHNDLIVFIGFGTAKLVPTDPSTGSRMLTRFKKMEIDRFKVDLLAYLPYELLSELAFDGYSVDLWAVMITLYRLVTGQLPWKCATMSDSNFHMTCRWGMRKVLEVKRLNLNPDLTDLLDIFFKLGPRERLGLDEILRHPWMRDL